MPKSNVTNWNYSTLEWFAFSLDHYSFGFFFLVHVLFVCPTRNWHDDVDLCVRSISNERKKEKKLLPIELALFTVDYIVLRESDRGPLFQTHDFFVPFRVNYYSVRFFGCCFCIRDLNLRRSIYSNLYVDDGWNIEILFWLVTWIICIHHFFFLCICCFK